jgi:transcriptional regulator with XRE-family HTH domain
MLNKLREIQRRERLTDSEMADKLGCSRPTWNLIKNGRRSLDADTAVRAAGVFPELSKDLLDMAADRAVSVANTGDRTGESVVAG